MATCLAAVAFLFVASRCGNPPCIATHKTPNPSSPEPAQGPAKVCPTPLAHHPSTPLPCLDMGRSQLTPSAPQTNTPPPHAHLPNPPLLPPPLLPCCFLACIFLPAPCSACGMPAARSPTSLPLLLLASWHACPSELLFQLTAAECVAPVFSRLNPSPTPQAYTTVPLPYAQGLAISFPT